MKCRYSQIMIRFNLGVRSDLVATTYDNIYVTWTWLIINCINPLYKLVVHKVQWHLKINFVYLENICQVPICNEASICQQIHHQYKINGDNKQTRCRKFLHLKWLPFARKMDNKMVKNKMRHMLVPIHKTCGIYLKKISKRENT